MPTRLLYMVVMALLMCLTKPVDAFYDSEQLELFDLVEEVKVNFYEFMELNQSCTPAEVKRQFRQLSLKMHPDKSDDPDAEAKFRHLVAISDVLKDESKRKKYDEILITGLPTWRNGIYYIRRVRKLGLFEISIIVAVICTVGHYLCLVAAYYEKLYSVTELLKKKKKLNDEEYNRLKQEGLETFGAKKPEFLKDNLPVRLTTGTYQLITVDIPTMIRNQINEHQQKKLQQKLMEEDEALRREAAEQPKVKKVRPKMELPEYNEEISYANNRESNNEKFNELALNAYSIKEGHWPDEDVHQLIKLSKKFPPGTNQRWERIATALGRTVDDVTKKAKLLKTGEVRVSEALLEQHKQPNTVATNADTSSRVNGTLLTWTQEEQTLFEKALQAYPKGTEERWDKIAAAAGKTKEDCILRFKCLSELVKKKRLDAVTGQK